jgi:hypothetical protein
MGKRTSNFRRNIIMPVLWMIMVSFAGNAKASVPPAPMVTSPSAGGVVNSNRPDITWTGGFHDAYEVHIGLYNVPTSAEGWNSGTVNVGSPVTSARSAPLTVQQTYYVYVRHHNTDGWGPWSQPNVHFYVAGEFLNNPNVIANTGGPLWWSDAAYNPARNEYCMTWQNGYVIHWRRLDSTGAALGIEFVLSDGVTQGHHYSVVCYNSAQQEYLIFYSGWIDGVGDHMRVLRVNAITGIQIGTTIYLDTIGLNSTTGGLDITYSSTSNSYMAVYESYTEGNIYGWRLDTFGNPTGSRIQIDTPSQLYSRNPQVTWNSVNNEYLATYMGSPGDGFNYFAQRVSSSNGALLGSNLALTTSNAVYNFGGVAYDSNANRYLVVYDGGASPPYGQLVSNTATLVGSAFAIGSGTATGWSPAACYDSSKHEFIVSWSGNQTALNYSGRVSQAGVPISNPADNTDTWGAVGIGNWPPRPVYNSVNDEFLIHWHNSYATILDRRWKTYPVMVDTTSPSPVTGLTLQRFPSSIILNWTNPSTADFMGTRIRYKTTGFPIGPTDGVEIASRPNAPSTTDTFTHTSLVKGVTYYYAVFAHDEAINYATGTLGSAKIFPGDFDGDDDVDMKDFAHLQNCFSGEGIPYGAGCTDADLNEDSDVDQSDFVTFLPCLAGADMPPGC